MKGAKKNKRQGYKMKGYKPMRLETRKTQSRINNYARNGKVTKIVTEDGTLYNVTEFEKCLVESKRLKTIREVKKIYQNDLDKEPYTEIYENFSHTPIVYQRTRKNKFDKYYNVETGKLCVKTFDLLTKEIETISKALEVEPTRCLEVLKELYQQERQK
jgi:hypothetical protein